MAENADTIPQHVQLEDGSWRRAPWVRWVPHQECWQCILCKKSGTCITADHLSSNVHVRNSDLRTGYTGWYTAELGQKIVDVWTHELYRRPTRADAPAATADPAANQLAVITPAPPPGLENQLLDNITEQLDRVTDRIDRVTADLDEKLDRVMNQLERANQRIDAMTDQLDVITERLNVLNDQFRGAPRGAAAQAARGARNT